MGWEIDPIWLAHIFQLGGSTASTNDIFRFFDRFPRIVCSGVLGYFLYMECFFWKVVRICVYVSSPPKCQLFHSKRSPACSNFLGLFFQAEFGWVWWNCKCRKLDYFFPAKKHMVILKNKRNTSWKVETTRNLGVSENSGTPKSSILIGFSIINHPFWGTTIFGNTHKKPRGFWVVSFQHTGPPDRHFVTSELPGCTDSGSSETW